MDLLGLVKDQLSSTIISKISNSLGESTTATQTALGGAMPAILGGLMQQASTTQGAGQLLNLLNSDGHDGKLLNGLSDALDNSQKSGAIANIGKGLLNSIFGEKLAGLTNVISNISGLGQGSSSSLLSIAAPILMGVIGKHVSAQGLGVSGFANLLMSQKDAVTKALPAGMDKILDVNKLGDFVGSTKPAVANTINEVADSGIRKWLPWLLLGLLALGAIFYIKQCQNPAAKIGAAIDSTASVATKTMDSTASTVKSGIASLGDFFKRKLPNGIELNIPENGIENKLIKFVDDKNIAIDKTTWFNFDRINFDTGKYTLKPESQEQIKNIAEILKAYPNVDIKIGGYTDNTGDAKANVKLSQERANTVMNAIVKEGIEAKRMAAEGYGSEHPEASNDTEEGRAKNRRIAVRVTKK